MNYTKNDIITLLEEENVEFVRLEFTDIYGKPRSMTIMPEEFEKAVDHGISIDGSAIPGLGGDNIHSDLFLSPDLDSISYLPWRPDQGKAVRLFSYIKNPDGSYHNCDSRKICLKEYLMVELILYLLMRISSKNLWTIFRR